MEVDYKELCQRLFGTTDVEELEKIAEKYQAKNDRGAGRKPKFSKAEYYFMNLLHKFLLRRPLPQQKQNGTPDFYKRKIIICYRGSRSNTSEKNYAGTTATKWLTSFNG